MTLRTMSVRLYMPGANPAHINPDSLRFNGVIPSEWVIVRPVTLEAGLSRVDYENGLSISASQLNVFFNQSRLENPDTELVVLDVARRYLDQPPAYLRFNSIVIGFAFGVHQVDRPLSLAALAATYEGIAPAVSLRSMYNLSDKQQVEVTVQEALPRPGGGSIPMTVRGQVWYGVTRGTPPDDLAFVRQILENQTSTFETFLKISQAICTRYIELGAQL